MSEAPFFDAPALLASLVDGGVRFIVVGGIAAQSHGSPMMTGDLDICFDRDRQNLERLAAVLVGLAAVRRGMPDGVEAPIDARALRAGQTFTLTTRLGDLDLLGAPDPGFDFATLARGAVRFEYEGSHVLMAGLDDLIAMKRAAGRPKDLLALEILGALREEIDRPA
jgi:hypothetical protein